MADIPADAQLHLENTIRHSLDLGMNHIETARGYGPSEMQLGHILPTLPREKMIVQTKVGPSENPQEFLDNFEKSLSYLQLDYVDLLGFHGINNQETLDWTIRKGGCLEVARKLQKEGRVRFVGFSTHGTTDVIVRANETGEFDYLNLHWYFVNELNWPAIQAATKNDMGVFIISPTDKGGMLQTPSKIMVELCEPLEPMQFNDLWCLNHPEIHTLSIGAARPSDLDAHVASLKYYDYIEETIAPIEKRVRAAMIQTWGADWCENWHRGLPEYFDLAGEINVLEILRLLTYAKPLDLIEWGNSRYNLLGNAGHWLPGQNTGTLNEEQWLQLQPQLAENPFAAKIPALLKEAHELFKGAEKQRLSQSE